MEDGIMEKQRYVKPQMEAIRTGAIQLLSGSGVQAEDELFNIEFGGIDEEGIVKPQ